MLTTCDLFDLDHTIAKEYLSGFSRPWEALDGLKTFLAALGPALSDHREIAPQVWVHPTAKIAPTAHLGEGCIIGPGAEVRHCAFIRGSALVGAGCVVGNSTEIKNAILFDNVQVPHYNYVGDSILGYKAHMGAGAVTSNVKSDRTPVVIRMGDEAVDTGLKKLGALLGDHAEIGCGCVLNPGCIIGRESSVYPLCSVRGFVPPRSIYKTGGVITARR